MRKEFIKGLPMIRQLIKYVNVPSLKVLLLLFFAFLINGCTSSKPPEFGIGLVFPNSENTISLDGFWFNLEGGGVSQADKIAPVFDPIGGYLFLYWIDDKGNVCHGQPGVSGQPGAAYIKAYKQQAWDIGRLDTTITDSQMLEFQKIPYSIDPYLAYTQASGSHFVQYGNIIMRYRDTGLVSLNKSNPFFSAPLVISVDTTNTLFPFHPDQQVHCSLGFPSPVPVPSVDRPKGQNPDMCGVRALPFATSMNYQESINYCLINLPEGMTWWDMH